MSGWRLQCSICGEVLQRWDYKPPSRVVSEAKQHHDERHRHSWFRRQWAKVWP